MDYSRILNFKGTWRGYQQRVLNQAEKYVQDGKIHIVAAPGSGKTTLGIELIAKMKEPALILTPSITIRQQWAARIAEGFLIDGLQPKDYISQDLRDPRCITVATYQALHSAMQRYKGVIDETQTTVNSLEGKMVDYSSFDLIGEMQKAQIGVLCLDECHHLRSEWWKALEDFKNALGNVKLIALTATPPYDSTPAMWKRYIDMCGEVDEEITVPELVKEKSLCPHQDYVYFNYPTEEEMQEVEKFKTKSLQMSQKLEEDPQFLEALKTHGGLKGCISEAVLAERAEYYKALLCFMKEKNETLPASAACYARNLEKMSLSIFETLLQGFLYEDADSYQNVSEYQKLIENELKAQGLIEKKKVGLVANEAIEKLLINSKGKCKSIQSIVRKESMSMGKQLRLLILSDYIRKEYEKAVGDETMDVTSLGVLPHFEQLRREENLTDVRLGILCGTIVVIPAEAREALQGLIADLGKVNYEPFGKLLESDYVKVTVVGDNHFLTQAVTTLFEEGYMQVLIGTKSLLGEGWDSPCINSLVMASFVGSYMLSNQMRGRAIRVFKEQPDKSSNIWHLICLPPTDTEQMDAYGKDFELLSRRMEHFLGLHYEKDIIENGMERLSYIIPPYTKENIEQINTRMLAMAKDRSVLMNRWEKALNKGNKIEIADETAVEESIISKTETQKTKSRLYIAGAGVAAGVVLAFTPLGWIGGIAAAVSGIYGVTCMPKANKVKNPAEVLKSIGEGIYLALKKQNLIEEKNGIVCIVEEKRGMHSIYLAGGSGRDRMLFAQCVKEFFSAVNNQRYLLVKEKRSNLGDDFYCIPECFAKKKESAQLFYEHIKPYIGNYMLVYTRNEEGKALLLEGHIKSVEKDKQRVLSHKVVHK